MMHFLPLFQISPYFLKKFQTLENFPIVPFPEKFIDFHPMTFFLVINRKFWIFLPIFPVSVHFPHVSQTFFLPPYFYKIFPPVFEKFMCFLHTLCVFRFPPYFDHDAFMHLTQCTYWTPLVLFVISLFILFIRRYGKPLDFVRKCWDLKSSMFYCKMCLQNRI